EPSPARRPSRRPAASGSTGARRRVAIAWATSSGASATLTASAAAGCATCPAISELREVGLALLEEGAERFLRLGALQAGAEVLAFGRDRLVEQRRRAAAA